VDRAKAILALEEARRAMTGEAAAKGVTAPSAASPHTATARDVQELFASLGLEGREKDTGIGSLVFALKPGDGSAREQAASCQKVLGGRANIAGEYATKRYRSNVVNWGMLPFVLDEADKSGITIEDTLFIPGIRAALASGAEEVTATLFSQGKGREILLRLPGMSEDERTVILAGCLMNYYAGENL